MQKGRLNEICANFQTELHFKTFVSQYGTKDESHTAKFKLAFDEY